MLLRQLLTEKKFANMRLRRALDQDSNFNVEWDDSIMQYRMIGNRSGHTYKYSRDEGKLARMAASLRRRRAMAVPQF